MCMRINNTQTPMKTINIPCHQHTPHKQYYRRISESMQRLYRTSNEARAARSRTQAGRLKTCSHCGQEGHNRRGCPLLQPNTSQAATQAATQGGHEGSTSNGVGGTHAGATPTAVGAAAALVGAAASGGAHALHASETVGNLKNQRCVLCGQHGHNRRTCPHRHATSNTHQQHPTAVAADGVQDVLQRARAIETSTAVDTTTNAACGESTAATTTTPAAAAVDPPHTVQVMVAQAVEAIVGAWRAGVTRQYVEVVLPAPPAYNKWNPWCVCVCVLGLGVRIGWVGMLYVYSFGVLLTSNPNRPLQTPLHPPYTPPTHPYTHTPHPTPTRLQARRHSTAVYHSRANY